MKLEVVVVPVSDVDRAKDFYKRMGWRLDADFVVDEDFRVVQLTPPGSACSVIFGTGITSAAPGSLEGLQLTVLDIEGARAELVGRGVDVVAGQPHDTVVQPDLEASLLRDVHHLRVHVPVLPSPAPLPEPDVYPGTVARGCCVGLTSCDEPGVASGSPATG